MKLQSIVHMNSGGIAHCHPDWSWDVRQRPFTDYDLWCVLAGQGSLQTPSESFTVGTGDCFILRPNQGYVGHHNPDNPLHVIFIHFDPIEKTNLPPLHRKLHDLTLIQNLLIRAVTAFQDGRQIQANAWLQTALQDIQHQDTHRPKDDQTTRIDMICDHIRAHPERTHRLSTLASELHLSTDHFTRLFKQHKGTTPREFILNARIDAACTLLTASNHPIARIADILGYSDIYYFSKQFKSHTGFTPTQYRKHRK